MTSAHHLSWDNFRATVFLQGQKRVHRVSDSPRIEVFGDGIANRIGLLLEVPSDTLLPADLTRLELIRVRLFSEGGSTFVEVTTSTTSLHRQFYHFAAAVAERVTAAPSAALEAVGLELQCFTALLEERPLLSTERQIGLLGELLFLQRLVIRAGVDIIDSWLGPASEPHDFRVHMREFEVKTTLSPHRVHTIHGTEQLVPSEGCSLYLISILLGPAGAVGGFSLTSKVAELHEQFGQTAARARQFMTALEVCGLNATDNEHYSRPYSLRRPMAIVPVNSVFPSISRPGIQRLLGPLAARIESVQYDVSVEGLEREDHTPEFEAALPG
jgi:hypothetical protein